MKKLIAAALKAGEKDDMKLVNDFCKKHGFDMKKVALSYQKFQNDLVVYERESHDRAF